MAGEGFECRRKGSLFDVGRDLDLDHLVWVGDGARLAGAFLDLVDELHAGHDLAPHGVLAIEEVAVLEADEELAAGAVGFAGPRHRYSAAHMLLAAELG